ncbi:polyphosphate kinase 2 [Phaeobacter sp.]|uniref:polyphosphate kinase 2 n=1 Tax=Phaeobacter sp. TaxID=1902409 RepID=UPI0025EBE87A|nr:polyphosphate kinase 2 [Phaeobacter sp.]
MPLPFDGAISHFFKEEAPAEMRSAILAADKGDMLDPSYPCRERLSRKIYERDMAALQIELVKMQAWVRDSGARIAILFEGRDAAGKGGTIKRFRENLNPRGARVVALSKPTEQERSQWYFQRYIAHLPSAGELTFFDRSWYNRGVVEHVFGFCSAPERERFFSQVNGFEAALVEDGIQLFKIWLTVGRAEQLRRFLAREDDPLKQWKLSSIDVKGLARWDSYSAAIAETLRRSDAPVSPWTVVRADDKRRARLAAIRHVLRAIDYPDKNEDALAATEPDIEAAICGGADLWHA